MKAVSVLPENYRQILAVDMKEDKKLFWIVNGSCCLIALVLCIAMQFVVPISTFFDMRAGVKAYLLRCVSLIVFMLIYLILHELTHGAAMHLCGTRKVRYGFTGAYAFAASDDYYDKTAYIFTALAPIVLWGVVLAVINFVVPAEWFWVVYFVQVINLSGAAGDLYISIKFSKLPKDILICDSGIAMKVFSMKDI